MRSLFLFFGLIVICQALTGFSSYYGSVFGNGYVGYTTHLDASQVVPQISNNFGGNGACLLNRNIYPMELTCQVVHNVESTSSVQLTIGGRGTTGEALFTVTAVNLNAFAATFVIDTSIPAISPKQFLSFLDIGAVAIVVNSNDYPNGAIKGQLGQDWSYFSIMDASQVQDDDDTYSSTSTSLGVALYQFNPTNNALRAVVYHNVQDYYKSGIYLGHYGHTGPQYFAFVPSSSPVNQTFTLSSEQANLLATAGLYTGIPSVEFPRGAIRGQIAGGAAFTYTQVATLDGQPLGVNTLARGIGLFSYNCAYRVFDYFIVHTVLGVKSIGIFDGSQRLFSVPNPSSPAIGNRALTVDQQSNLFNGNFGVRIESNTFTHGEISGTVSNTTANYAAVLTGRNMLPPITTNLAGGFILSYLGNRVVEYALILSISNGKATVTSIDFFIGALGQVGTAPQWSIPNPSSQGVITEGLKVLNNEQLNALFAGNLYIVVNTFENPRGEIRGQISRLFGNQCSAFPGPGCSSSTSQTSTSTSTSTSQTSTSTSTTSQTSTTTQTS